MKSRLQKLSKVLIMMDELPWKHALYLAGSFPWTENTLCAVLDPNETDDPDEVPDFAKQNELKYALSVHEVQGIVANAKQQLGKVAMPRLIEAFNFYYKNDAFIEF